MEFCIVVKDWSAPAEYVLVTCLGETGILKCASDFDIRNFEFFGEVLVVDLLTCSMVSHRFVQQEQRAVALSRSRSCTVSYGGSEQGCYAVRLRRLGIDDLPMDTRMSGLERDAVVGAIGHVHRVQ